MSVHTVQKIQKAGVETVVFFLKCAFILALLIGTTFGISIAMAISA